MIRDTVFPLTSRILGDTEGPVVPLTGDQRPVQRRIDQESVFALAPGTAVRRTTVSVTGLGKTGAAEKATLWARERAHNRAADSPTRSAIALQAKVNVGLSERASAGAASDAALGFRRWARGHESTWRPLGVEEVEICPPPRLIVFTFRGGFPRRLRLSSHRPRKCTEPSGEHRGGGEWSLGSSAGTRYLAWSDSSDGVLRESLATGLNEAHAAFQGFHRFCASRTDCSDDEPPTARVTR
jgi:hypothetical protein